MYDGNVCRTTSGIKSTVHVSKHYTCTIAASVVRYLHHLQGFRSGASPLTVARTRGEAALRPFRAFDSLIFTRPNRMYMQRFVLSLLDIFTSALAVMWRKEQKFQRIATCMCLVLVISWQTTTTQPAASSHIVAVFSRHV